RQRPRDLEPALVAVWQLACRSLAHLRGVEADRFHQAVRVVHASPLVAAQEGQRRQLHDSVIAQPSVHADHHVLQRGEIGKQADVLERARDPEPGDAMRRQARQMVPLEKCLARLGAHVTRDDVDQRGLAGAVGADEAENRALVDFERHAVDGLDAAEMPLEAIQPEQHLMLGLAAATSALRTNAIISERATWMPWLSAASSSCRIAAQARPRRPLVSRQTIKMTAATEMRMRLIPVSGSALGFFRPRPSPVMGRLRITPS